MPGKVSHSDPLKLRALLGDYPGTKALKSGAVRSRHVTFDFADGTRPSSAFKRVVRNLEFDFAELAIVTYRMAKAHGKPLVLLPAVVMARFQHPYLVYNTERGTIAPADLTGRRIGIRSYSVTTVVWIRGILAEHGVDTDSMTWVTFEESHLAEFTDPPTVERAPEGRTLLGMLLAGEIDAAILADLANDPRLKTLFPDPDAAARSWYQKHGALQINHMVVVKQSLSTTEPDAVREIYRLLIASKHAAGLRRAGSLDTEPFGLDANRHNLEVAIDYVYQQRLIPRRFDVDELFDATTRELR